MALTPAEIFEHLGRMVRHGYSHFLTDVRRDAFDQVTAWLLIIGKDYVTNGTFGTQADRLDAMLAARQDVFALLTGQNPADGGVGQHRFTQHFLARADDVLGDPFL